MIANRTVLDGIHKGSLLVAFLLGVSIAERSAIAAEIQFNRDIRPILSENCLACHGPDPAAREADLRLDTRAGLFESTEDRGPTVVPNDLEESELWYRIFTDDEDDVMPPSESNKSLEPHEKSTIKQWILDGAQWEDHWSFIKPEKNAVPEINDAAIAIRTPIDAFVSEKLIESGLTMNPEADRRTLARRLSLDLIGLPPTPEQVESFVNDTSPDYFENYVDHLLASKHWGEHRGRYWLDAARYADTHGLHFDNYREMWPYRDWVINAFNQNQPYDRFVVDQIAGDLLENPTTEQKVATGFQRCNITTNEGGTIEKENLALYANDRVTTTGWVFLGLTTNCGACHDHKFDPFTQKDFYSMAAFYRNTKQSGFDKNWREGDGAIVIPVTEHDRTRWNELPEELNEVGMMERLRSLYVADNFEDWKKNLAEPEFLNAQDKTPLFGDEYIRVGLAKNDRDNTRLFIDGRTFEIPVPPEMTWTNNAPTGEAPTLTKETFLDLQNVSDIDQNEPLSFSAWVYLPKNFKGSGSVAAQMAGTDQNNRGWDFFVADKKFGIHLIHSWPKVAMKAESEDVLETEQWHQITAVYNGSSRSAGVQLFVDGKKVKTRGGQNRLEDSIRTDLNIRIGRRQEGSELNGVTVQDLRVYRRQLDHDEIKAQSAAPRLSKLLAQSQIDSRKPKKPIIPEGVPDEEKVAADESHKAALQNWAKGNHARDSLRAYYERVQFAPTRLAALDRVLLTAEKDRIRARSPYTHVQTEMVDSQPMARVLMRGQYDKEADEVTANTPGFLPPMPDDAPKNRLGLARWIVSLENPLTARVAVNRFWQELFGTGIVATAEDFGVVGELPVNQKLLDWLAVEFIESGWDVKHMYKLMVISSAYRQSATVTPAKLERDRDNRLISRGPRFRMDAEMVRDYALAVSGLLEQKIGGRSVKPYQPEGVWEAVAMPESNTRHYEQDHGKALYRRSMYTFWKRAAPPATMDIFNAPSREVCAVKRERTNTPLQALATLNDPTFVEAARKLAEGAMHESGGGSIEPIDILAKRILLRPLTPGERAIVGQTLKDMRVHFEQQPRAATQFLSIGESEFDPNLPPTELAAFGMVANQLMNLDEVLNK